MYLNDENQVYPKALDKVTPLSSCSVQVDSSVGGAQLPLIIAGNEGFDV